MQIKHTWTEHVEKGFMSEKFTYRLVLRGALTQTELDVINKYKVMTAWVYSNRQEREDQKIKPGMGLTGSLMPPPVGTMAASSLCLKSRYQICCAAWWSKTRTLIILMLFSTR